LGLAHEEQSGFSSELTDAAEAVAADLGWHPIRVNNAADEAASDVVLAIGNVRLFPDLLSRPKAALRVLWHGETLPRHTPESGGAIHRLLPTGRLLDSLFAVAPAARGVDSLARGREQAAMVREPVANLALLRRAVPAFDRIVIDAFDRAEGAIAAGITVEVVPYGYHESYAGPLTSGGERPIDALLLGHLVGNHGRRQRLLGNLSRQLADRGIELRSTTAGSYGMARYEQLKRTKVVIDIHRLPGNSPGFRFMVAAAAGAALVSEPLARAEPLVPGVHYREAATDRIADAVAELLANEPERQRLVAAAQNLLSTDLAMSVVLPRVLHGLAP
jgi:hypothetical protein